ncbi:MAG TPA: FtsQ-type POTRA domain-containing protein [Thermoclostridium sp.]|nr:FtsQ-type POTRA domain-containing protein [Clostridiaceae bacterium]HOQ76314.1 FtsQ-type POTRA domain-containing protein [Thermoclostridium sp.]HPU45179.1 FtsQ-type POTRA domain-containing protein [Thermoclostridium sp.]
MSRGKKRRKKLIKVLLLMLLVIPVLLVVMLLFTPFFNITDIRVEGAGFYTQEEIRLASGIAPGENAFRKIRFSPEAILGLRLLDAEAAIEALPRIKDARVFIIFPNQVGISVTERSPSVYLSYLGSYLTVDAEGYVLEVSRDEPPAGLKELRGIDFTKYSVGQQLETADVGHVRIADNIVRAIRKSDENSEFLLWPVVDWIDVVDDNTAMMSYDNRVVVRFDPTDRLQYTIDFSKQIFFTKISATERGRLEFIRGQNPSFIPD